MTEDKAAALPRIASFPRWLRGELRSDHAGETGAVWLYLGMIRFSRDPEVIDFAWAHLETEREHLNLFDAWLASGDKSRLIPVWRLAGWMLGAIAAIGGRNMTYLTVSAVEKFVVGHYEDQINALEGNRLHPEVSAVLKRFSADENAHRREADERVWREENSATRLWRMLIASGSSLAVMTARRL